MGQRKADTDHKINYTHVAHKHTIKTHASTHTPDTSVSRNPCVITGRTGVCNLIKDLDSEAKIIMLWGKINSSEMAMRISPAQKNRPGGTAEPHGIPPALRKIPKAGS